MMKKFAALLSVLLLLGGCDGSQNPDVTELPEVNDENCKMENVAKISPEDARQRFSSLCVRSSNFKPSPPREW